METVSQITTREKIQMGQNLVVSKICITILIAIIITTLLIVPNRI